MRKAFTLLLISLAVFSSAHAQIDDGGFDPGIYGASGPVVTLTEPALGSVYTVNTVTVRGQVAPDPDNPSEIAGVKVKSADGLLRVFSFNATLQDPPCTVGEVCNWEATVNRLQPGQNVITAEATDKIGGIGFSAPVTVTYNAPGQTPLTLEEPPVQGELIAPPPAGVPPPPPGQPLSEFEQMLFDAGQIATGADEVFAFVVLSGLAAAFVYVAYTRTNMFRRKEAEHLADKSHKNPPDFKDPA